MGQHAQQYAQAQICDLCALPGPQAGLRSCKYRSDHPPLNLILLYAPACGLKASQPASRCRHAEHVRGTCRWELRQLSAARHARVGVILAAARCRADRQPHPATGLG